MSELGHRGQVLGNSVLTCPHDQHRRQRRLTQPAFHPAHRAAQAAVMTEQIAAVTASWRDGGVIDVPAEMEKITARVLLATMFSASLSPQVMARLSSDLTVVLAGIFRRMFLPAALDRLPTVANRRYHRASSRLRHTVTAAVTDRLTAPGQDNGDGTDLLSLLLGAGDATGDAPEVSDTELADQAVTFFVAGVETTATTLAWALHLLSRNADVEQRLHAEVDAVLAGQPATYDGLPTLPLTGHIVRETLRLYPPLPLSTRITTHDTRLGDHVIPVGTTIAYSPYLIHHRADTYPDPERFHPGRWTGAALDGALPRDAFFSFGGGARKCIGDQFGLTEATLALATITACWELRPAAGTDSRPQLSSALRPKRLLMHTTDRTRRASP
ncbi:cytochrome P450 [Streptomyces sp. NPDC001093]|uniref:cytochrome P450 n=1 Tax=Streptomyces sp. NPDC001093 TaxID=3154376 RepID=UPI00332A36E6